MPDSTLSRSEPSSQQPVVCPKCGFQKSPALVHWCPVQHPLAVTIAPYVVHYPIGGNSRGW